MSKWRLRVSAVFTAMLAAMLLTASPGWAAERSQAPASGGAKGGTATVKTGKKDATRLAAIPRGKGYWVAGSDGAVFAFGDAPYFGSMSGTKLNQPIVGMASTPTGLGYWLVATDGGIFSFGDAKFYGSTGAIKLNKPIVGMTSTPTGLGYWLVASDGGIFSYGDAKFFGSTGSMKLNQPVVGMSSTPFGRGYWLVAADGGIFSYGDATFFGSTGSIKLNQPVVGMSGTPSGNGYWLVASDGGVFSYGDATFFGSTGSIKLNQPIVGMDRSVTGRGYRFVASDGGVFTFGDAGFYGSNGWGNVGRPAVSLAGTPALEAWPELRQTNTRSAFTRAPSVVGNASQLWTVTDPNYDEMRPPVVGPNDVVYVAVDKFSANTPGLYAFDAATGLTKWLLKGGASTPYPQETAGAPVVGPDGTVYVDFLDALVAFRDDGTSVTELWRFPTIFPSRELTGPPTLGADGTVYVPNDQGELVAVSPPAPGSTVGTQKWAFQTAPAALLAGNDRGLKSFPAIGPDGTIFVGSDENQGVLWALKDDGTQATVVKKVVNHPEVAANFSAAPAGELRADVNVTPAIDAANNTVYITSDDGNLWAYSLSPALGAVKWTKPIGQPDVNNPPSGFVSRTGEDAAPAVGRDGTVVAVSDDGNVYAFNANGTTKWTVTPCAADTIMESSPAISASGVVVLGSGCGFFAYKVSDGAPLWNFSTGANNVEPSPAIGRDGTVYWGYVGGPTTAIVLNATTGTIGDVVQ